MAVAGMLKRRFENIITYLEHRITNAASESINSKIPQQAELHQRNLLPLRWPGPRPGVH
jgi:hypothetical protein